MAGGRSGGDGLAIHGGHLAELVQRFGGVFEGSEAVFGDDLPGLAGGGGGFAAGGAPRGGTRGGGFQAGWGRGLGCARAHAGGEARRRLQGALGQGFLGQDLGGDVAEDFRLLGDAREDFGKRLRAASGGQAQQDDDPTRADEDTHTFIVRRSGRRRGRGV